MHDPATGQEEAEAASRSNVRTQGLEAKHQKHPKIRSGKKAGKAKRAKSGEPSEPFTGSAEENTFSNNHQWED